MGLEWLATPDGHALAIAIIGLLNAVTIAITISNNRKADKTQKLLNGHLDRHMGKPGPEDIRES